jgi:ribonuclease BN (tRNA processing enzyme)
MAELVVLGSGTGIPTCRRSPPGLLLKTDKGDCLLIDPGPGTLSRMVHHGAGVEDVGTVLLTHHHPDHTLDLMALLFARHNPGLRPRLKKLFVAGPPGTRDLHERMKGLYGHWVEAEEGMLEIIEAEAGALPTSLPLSGTAHPMKHGPSSLGYRLRLGHRILAVSGDTGPCDALQALGEGADLFLLECALPDSHPSATDHMTPDRAGRIAALTCPKKLVLYHLYPAVNEEEALQSIRRHYQGPVQIAEDGDLFSLAGKV